MPPLRMPALIAVLATLAVASSVTAAPRRGRAEAHGPAVVTQVSFPSLDGRVRLVGYLFRPREGGRRPAVVLMHGRSGAYSSTAGGAYSAATLRRRDADWARLWTSRGYVALIVDSFGPRGYPRGFAAGTHAERPPEISEVTVRPLDAYAALAYLAALPEIDARNIALMGWSNGASAVLVAMAEPHGPRRFRLGVALYPGCGLDGRFSGGYQPYAGVEIFIGQHDEEVAPQACRRLTAIENDVTLVVFPGATHDFDDPANHRQDLAANRSANAAARGQIVAFVAAGLDR